MRRRRICTVPPVESSGSELVYATEGAKIVLRAWIAALTAGGRTNFDQAFTYTFDLFATSTATCVSEDTGNPMNRMNVILLMTDGVDTSNVAETTITAMNTNEHDATIFTYSLGLAANSDRAKTLPKAIACANYGKWTPVIDASQLAMEMERYFEFLQASVALSSR